MSRAWLVRALLLVAAVAAAVAGAASFPLGTCHDGGGFCADEFSSTHVEGYAGGSLLLGLACGLAASALALRLRPTLIWGTAAAGAVALSAVLLEMS